MEIKFLKAGTGDCIVIHNEDKNIIIDGGNDSTFLIEEYGNVVKRGERIDLLVITHHDDDHIKGVLELFHHLDKKSEQPQISTVLFNSPRKINNTLGDVGSNGFLSYKQAYELENALLKNRSINWITSLEENFDETITNQLNCINIRFFSPDKEILLRYSSDKDAYLTSDYRCDWNSSFKELTNYIDDKSQDTSISNQTSIVILLTHNDQKVLLTGDITPGRLENIIDEIKGDNSKADFYLIKLPHHGSYRSINNKILQKINCNRYMISTNGCKHYLPNKRALVKIIKEYSGVDPVAFSFNYSETANKLKLTPKELMDYRINLLSNNYNWGYGINI